METVPRNSPEPWEFELLLGDASSESFPTSFRNISYQTVLQACSDHMEAFVATVIHKTKGRRFFTTEKGYMGFGQLGIEKGDHICVCLGCDVPLIFCRVDERYVNEGECFVLGLMDGEALNALNEGILSMQDFEIH